MENQNLENVVSTATELTAEQKSVISKVAVFGAGFIVGVVAQVIIPKMINGIKNGVQKIKDVRKARKEAKQLDNDSKPE